VFAIVPPEAAAHEVSVESELLERSWCLLSWPSRIVVIAIACTN
jgi:hypothetical protein